MIKTICLNMIVKNESKVIEETLKNLTSFIKFDYWVISDTGSTDNTMEIIKKFFENLKIPGELVQHEWRDFGYNRSKALEAAYNKTDYLLVFDADDRIHGKFKLPEKMIEDSYYLKFGQDFSYVRTLIINNRKVWKYIGVLHEYIACQEQHKQSVTIEGNYYVESGRTGNRSQDPDKYFKDAKILEKAFNEEPDRGLADRYAFYCAQSYKDCGRVEESIEWYKKVLTLNNWYQEKCYAALMLGNLYKNKNDHLNAIQYYIKSNEYDHERIEGIVDACELFRNNGMHLMVTLLYKKFKGYIHRPDNKLFISLDKYDDMLEYNNSICAYYSKDLESGYEACRTIIMNNKAPQYIIHSAYCNIHFYPINKDPELFKHVNKYVMDHKNDASSESLKLWEKLFDKTEIIKFTNKTFKNKSKPRVMITFTTCKRFDLFHQTLNSMIHNWTDIDLIDYWFCVDDNSSKEDRKLMQTRYKWIDYYMKGPDEKGHRKSMNVIWDKLNQLKPTYWIHMEDDFLFHQKMDYITQSIKYLNEMEKMNIHQILFNRNYAETMEGYRIMGHQPYNNDICLHEHKVGTFNFPNCLYWPHYSFRPSMIRTKVILELGNYDSPNQFFERDYADKYYAKGYRAAFFDKITCTHIGKLTSEKDKPNAYILNQEEQFVNQPNNKFKVVNLVRRKDRREQMEERLKKLKFADNDYEFVEATDGHNLKPTYEIAKLFRGNDFGNRKGVIGAALSHYKLWQQLLDSKYDYFLILEDDVILADNFKEEIQKIDFKKYEFLFLGYLMFSHNLEKVRDKYYSKGSAQVERLAMDYYIGGFHCYSINRSGAQKMMEYIQTNNIKHGIDYLMKLMPNLECWETVPMLAFADWNEGGKPIDSDIQNLYDGIDFSEFNDAADKFIFLQGQDQIGCDLYYKRISVDSCFDVAIEDPNCVAFNTLGFFKNGIENLTPSPYFKEKDGIYVKREYYNTLNKTRVKMICNWCSSQQLVNEWGNMCEKNNCWKNIKITADDENIDYYVIINKPLGEVKYDPKKTLVFQMEPWILDENKNWGVKTWGDWAEPNENEFLHVHTHKKYLNNVQWQKSPPDNFPENRQNKAIAILSNKYFDDGHIKRVNFIKYLDENNISLIDIYGYQNFHNFKNYMGQTDKSQLADYKYCFSVENNAEHNYATEKIWEPILHEMLCFYWGCPNLDDYINPLAYVRLDLDDLEKSAAIIKQAIEEDWWSQRIGAIREAKKKILEELGFFPTLDKLIHV